MIKAYSQRLSPPFSGQAQIAESDRARAITLDGRMWEIHFTRGTNGNEGQGYMRHQRSFVRVAHVSENWIRQISEEGPQAHEEVDQRILELVTFIANATLPFPVVDHHEYWLLDAKDDSPLALIFSCVDADQRSTFPDHPEWTALPAAVMPIERSEEELANGEPPVNYQVERLVADRAGYRPRAKWFYRENHDPDEFPPMLVTEEWADPRAHELCQRYVQRQSPRLLMLHGLAHENRLRLEQAASDHALEVARFYPMYPEVADPELMNTLRVEARMRSLTEEEPSINRKRDGILYL